MNSESSAPATPYLILMMAFYSALIVYGTLFPFTGWDPTTGGIKVLWQLKWPDHFSRTDVLVNFLIYIPLGYLIGLSCYKYSHNRIILIVTLLGFALCTFLEYIQTFLPERDPSLLDILLNTIGSLVGALLSILLGYQSQFARYLQQQKHELFLPLPLSNLVLLTAVFWALAQLTPLVPSPDIGNLRSGLKPMWTVIKDPGAFITAKYLSYTLSLSGLCLLLISFNRPNHPILGKLTLFLLAVLFLKIPIIDRSLSFEALFGMLTAIILSLIFDFRSPKLKSLVIITFLLASYAVEGLSTYDSGGNFLLHPMNWIPFLHQMGDVVGLVDLVFSIWIFMALAAATLMIKNTPSLMFIVFCSLLVALFSFSIEHYQLRVSGRYADITDVLVAGLTYLFCMLKFRTSSYSKPDYDYTVVGRFIE